ncbi:hypothetical protein KIN20_026811 [Parelaphostrongylus tenuis]|uniref:Uncharacterized protein n=1 Tax=Parelaphostrongylus tenuis TaxID=148309 RepID=A0AAD5QYJ9_PARTN|nr:hypothetical protein KIN20_026811 [Parelaphostrongylus tenuis]
MGRICLVVAVIDKMYHAELDIEATSQSSSWPKQIEQLNISTKLPLLQPAEGGVLRSNPKSVVNNDGLYFEE